MKSEVREIKKVKIGSAVKVFLLIGVLYAILTIIQSILLMSFPSIALQLGIDASSLTIWTVAFAAVLVVIIYMLAGLILAAVYNLIAKMVGGIKVVLE